jgi:hypothetical protein
LFGKKLPSFASQTDAERELYAFRDARLQKLSQVASATEDFELTWTPESLKGIEAWYFELWENNAFEVIGSTREEFEECMAMYFGEVFVRNVSGAKWIVEEYAFESGKYEIGVQKDAIAIMLRRETDHFKTPNNKRRQALWRQYRKYCR